MAVDIIIPDEHNIVDSGLGCIQNKKHEGFNPKVKWFRDQYKHGLRMGLLRNAGKTIGFVEYVPGEFAWRPVEAAGYLFIHCIWVYQKKEQHLGHGSKLIAHCVEVAIAAGMDGVAVLASDGSWLADKRLFLNNGFKRVNQLGRFDLLSYSLKKSPSPKMIDFTRKQPEYRGLHLLYADQCPLVAKNVHDLAAVADSAGIELRVKKISDYREAQMAPTGYGVFSLIKDGKILADHYISATRFKNILRKEYPGITL